MYHAASHRPPRNRLPRWQRLSIYGAVALLLLSGLGWLWVAYALAPPHEPTPAPHRLAGPLLALHGIAGYVGAILCALVGQVHLRTGWRVTVVRGAAATLAALLLWLVLSGLGFYYVADEALLPWLRWTHLCVGLVLPAALAWHIVRGRRALHRR